MLNADVDALCTVKGIGKRAAVLIRLIGDIVKRDIEKPDERPSLDTTNKMGEYMMRFFGEEAIESVVAVALDSRFRVIRVIKVAEGDFESVRFSSSKLARELVASKAVATVISHNHPSFNAMASSEDLRATRILTENLSKVGITLVRAGRSKDYFFNKSVVFVILTEGYTTECTLSIRAFNVLGCTEEVCRIGTTPSANKIRFCGVLVACIDTCLLL